MTSAELPGSNPVTPVKPTTETVEPRLAAEASFQCIMMVNQMQTIGSSEKVAKKVDSNQRFFRCFPPT